MYVYQQEQHNMTARMTIRRAVRELKMDCDIDESTDIVHIERDSFNQVTLYGKEEDGKLWYLTLNQEAVEAIQYLDKIEYPVQQVLDLLDEMHKIVFPGEYGLGSEPESVPDDKAAWERLGKLIERAQDALVTRH